MKYNDLIKEIKKNPEILSKKDVLGRNVVLFTSTEIEAFKLLKENGVVLTSFDENFQTVLTELVKANNLEVVQYLLKEEGFDIVVNYQDHKEKTPIFYAKTPEMIDLLCEYGADVFVVDEDCKSLLHKEWKEEDLPLIDKLLEKGLDLNETDAVGNTPIFYQKNVIAADYLVNKGAKLKVFNNFGTYPKTDYFRNHQKAMVKWFNAKLEELGETLTDEDLILNQIIE